MISRHTEAQASYPQLIKPKLILTNAQSYPEQNWKYMYARPRTVLELQPLLKAAYPNLATTHTNSADLALHRAGQVELTQWLIDFAQELGLIHFGRFKTEEAASTFRLEFSQPQKRNDHLTKLGWQLDNVSAALPEDNRLDVVIKNSSVNYFIDQFWSHEIPDKLKARARKNGLTLENMERQLKQQERKLESMLGDKRGPFDLLVASIENTSNYA